MKLTKDEIRVGARAFLEGIFLAIFAFILLLGIIALLVSIVICVIDLFRINALIGLVLLVGTIIFSVKNAKEAIREYRKKPK